MNSSTYCQVLEAVSNFALFPELYFVLCTPHLISSSPNPMRCWCSITYIVGKEIVIWEAEQCALASERVKIHSQEADPRALKHDSVSSSIFSTYWYMLEPECQSDLGLWKAEFPVDVSAQPPTKTSLHNSLLQNVNQEAQVRRLKGEQWSGSRGSAMPDLDPLPWKF